MDRTLGTHITRMPRGLRNASLVAGLLIAVASLSQCRAVEDRITGVDLTPSSASARSACVQRCNDQFKAARKAEQERLRVALVACGDSKSCKKEELARHQSNLAALVAQMQNCKRTCYNEGAGIGGR